MMNVIHTADHNMRKILEMAEAVAASRATVLIHGESGCGKELLARYIHTKSPRSGKRMVAVNCAAVPEGLLESELFGHEKGAFTGAEQRKVGKFEQAHDSTFLLDEISEMPLLLQAKLLRVIQEGEVERLGGQGPVKVNVRLVATTNRDLKEMVKKGEFREDLYYRLNVVPLKIPPLRERVKDIDLLAQIFMGVSTQDNGLELRRLSNGALEKLRSWRWPGNIRELQNVIERSVLLSRGDEMSADEILIENYVPTPSLKASSLQAGMTVAQMERALIMETLAATGDNRTQAARMLGISVRTLRNKLTEYREGGINERAV